MFMYIGKDVIVDSKDVVYVVIIKNLHTTEDGENCYLEFMNKYEILDISGGYRNSLIITDNVVYVSKLKAPVIYAMFNDDKEKMRTLQCWGIPVEFDVKSGKVIKHDDLRLDRELDVQEDEWG